MRNIINRIKRTNRQKLLYFAWTFTFITLTVASIFQVHALGDGGFQSNRTPAENSFLYVMSKEEIALVNPECEDVNGNVNADNYLGGSFKSATDVSTLFTSADSLYTWCAAANANAGDPSDAVTLWINYDGKGFNGALSKVNALFLNQRPASGSHFVEQKVYALTHIGQVNAQDAEDDPSGLYYRGTGFDLLRPIQRFWGWSVNVVYAFMIFIIIIVAFGIMFKSSLGGGLAITLQNSIPNIALAMILIPLSYAITGLFIDGITVGVNVVHEFLLGPGSPGRGVYDEASDPKGRYSCDNLVTLGFMDDCVNKGLHADDLRVSWMYAGSQLEIGKGLDSGIETIGIVFGISSFIDSVGLGGFLVPFVNFLIGILLLLTGLRIFWKLFQKYMLFLLMPLGAPFIFATIALPGSGSKTIMNYVRTMGAASMNYIVAYAMILLSIILSSSYFINQIPDAGAGTFVPPLTGLEGFISEIPDAVNAAGGSIIGFVMVFAAFGIYMLIPKTLEQVDAALGVEKAGIPQFLQDIFQSAKDSYNLGKAIPTKGYEVAKGAVAAPGQAAAAVRNARNWNARMGQNLRNVYDRRLRGINVGEVGSDLYRRVQSKEDDLAQAQREYRDAVARGDNGAARRAQGKISGLQNDIANLKQSSGIAEANKEVKGGSLKVEISFNSQSPLILNDGLMKQLHDEAARGLTTRRELYKGVLAIKSENFQLSPNVIDRLVLLELGTDTGDLRSDPSQNPANNKIKATGDAIFEPVPPLRISNLNNLLNFPIDPITNRPAKGVYLDFKIDPAMGYSVHPSGDGSKWEIPFAIQITDLPLFLDNLTPTSIINTPKHFFILLEKVGADIGSSGNVYSNIFDVMLITSYYHAPF